MRTKSAPGPAALGWRWRRACWSRTAEGDGENGRTLEKEQKEIAQKGSWGQGDLKMEKYIKAEVCVTFNLFNG